MSEALTFVSLFTGIGGFDLGFERAGLKCVAQVESDTAAARVLAAHYPGVQKFKDVKNVGKANLPTVGIVCGGFPCQDLSTAGKRQGLVGERSGLWFEFIRILAELKPRIAVIENVPGLLSSNKGRDFAIVLHGLEECGYCVAWRVLDAQYFGVPQRRRRVFIVASLGNGSCAQILFEREGGTGGVETGTSTRQGVTQSIENSVGERGAVGTLSASGAGTARTGNVRNETDMLITAFNMRRSDEYAPASVDATLAARDYKSATDLVAFQYTASAAAGLSLGDRSPTLRSGHRNAPAVAYGLSTAVTPKFGEEIAPTLTQPSPSGGGQPMAVASGFSVRRLTPIECERLQGFPDNWTGGQSDSARYRQLGNAVAVPVAEWLGRRILEATT